jgi:hypothetical protein
VIPTGHEPRRSSRDRKDLPKIFPGSGEPSEGGEAARSLSVSEGLPLGAAVAYKCRALVGGRSRMPVFIPSEVESPFTVAFLHQFAEDFTGHRDRRATAVERREWKERAEPAPSMG